MKTNNPELLNELVDIFLALCWNLERNPHLITGVRGDKAKLCFRPFYHPIGFEENPTVSKKAISCQTSVFTYLLRFLSGHISVSNGCINSKEIQKLFFQGMSADLAKLFHCPGLGLDLPVGTKRLTSFDKVSVASLVIHDFLELSKTSSKPLSIFKEGQALSKGKPVMFCNPMMINRVVRYTSDKKDWIILLGQAVYQANHDLQNLNSNLGLGLKTVPQIAFES